MNENNNTGYYEPKPSSDLEFNLWLTNTVWGSDWINPELKQHLTKHYAILDDEGNPVLDEQGRPLLRKESLWGLMNYFTRDLRLSNLNNNELLYCRYFLDLAGDFLKEGFFRSFIVALSRVATITELAQSKSGFLRKELRTSRLSQTLIEEPKKKGLFSKK